MGADRMRRVDETLRAVLGEAVRDLKDPRVGFLTVTEVKTSPDLRHARVYVSVLGEEGERHRSLDALQSAHGFLQRRIAAEVRLKHTPELAFVLDETAERAARLEQLLADAEERE
jgi:ribosome-binding factor A